MNCPKCNSENYTETEEKGEKYIDKTQDCSECGFWKSSLTPHGQEASKGSSTLQIYDTV